MIFMKNQPPRAIRIPFNWVADYIDGTHYSEYDFKTHEHNDFYRIQQQDVLRFGLIGQGMKFFFENSDGSFYLNGRYLNIGYEIDEKVHVLTNNQNKKDLITYKRAHTNIDKNRTVQNSVIESIDFGYKTKYKDDVLDIHFQPIVSLPFNDKAYIEVKLTSQRDLSGNIVFISRGKVVERFHAPLKKGVSGQINWTIK